MDTETLESKVKAIPYWYHRIELPGGIVTPGWAPIDAARYCVPQDLTGKRVLDIGAWDGYWTWEALKRGAAEVVAIDDFSDRLAQNVDRSSKWETFDLCREAFGFIYGDSGCIGLGRGQSYRGDPTDLYQNAERQKVARIERSVYEISESVFGHFDVVFFFGTIYHCKHPLLALERIASVCDGSLYVESAHCDDYSPYQGGLGHGYGRNDMVMEFYPQRQYDDNPSNWWIPTLQCLAAMVESVGFKEVSAWSLTDTPKELWQMRGFVSGTKDPAREPALRPPEVALPGPGDVPAVPAKVLAVMSVPRLCFSDNIACAWQAFMPLKIPVCMVQGAFWGQCLERGIQRMIDDGADLVVTIDYDTLFCRADVEDLLRLASLHPEAAAIVPVQVARDNHQPLMTMKTRSGQPLDRISLDAFKAETVPISTGHFGLTVLRVKDLLEITHPWFLGQPNGDGMWGPGRVDDDMYFWRKLGSAGKKVLLANRIVVGHMERLGTWPDETGAPVYETPKDYHEEGKPAKCWK
jgi:tRNA (mo5U34)-methyltransferase